MRTYCFMIAAVAAGCVIGCAAPQPFETVSVLDHRGRNGVDIAGVSVRHEAGGDVVRGRIRSSAQCGLAASHVVLAEATTETGKVAWTRIGKIHAKPVTRHSRLKHDGTFRLSVPEWSPPLRLRIEIVDAADVARGAH